MTSSIPPHPRHDPADKAGPQAGNAPSRYENTTPAAEADCPPYRIAVYGGTLCRVSEDGCVWPL